MITSGLRVLRSVLVAAALFGSASVWAQNAITQPTDPIFASSTNSPDGEGVGSAIDNNQATKYLNYDSGRDGNQIGTFSPSGFAVVPAAGPSRVTAILMQSANDVPERDPDTILLEGSNDEVVASYIGGSWEAIVTLTNIAAGFTNRLQEQTFSFRNNRVYKAYRWTVQSARQTPNGCCMQVAEVELLGTLGDQNVNHAFDITRPDDILLPSSDNSPMVERFWNAIDNSAETKYLNFDSGRDGSQIGTFSPSGFVVTPALTRTVVTGMTIQSANDEPDRDPDLVALFGSNDTNITNYATGTWEHITTLSNIAAGFISRFQEQTFAFTNATPYRSYKWEVQQVRNMTNGCCMQVGEVQLLGTVATELEEPVISAGSISLTAHGSSGDLLFLNRNYEVPVAQVDTAIRLDTVDSNGLAHFTLDETTGNAFFRTRRVSHPTVLGNGADAVKVLTFVQDTIVTNSGTAAFTVVAEGTTTNVLQYQWYKDDVAISGATSPTLIITNVSVADEGNFSCYVNMVGHPAVRVATPAYGSTGGRLTVTPNQPPPQGPVTLGDGTNAVIILESPQDLVVTNNGTAQFTVVAQGTVTNVLEYQWFWNEIPLTNSSRISGANGPILTITNAHFDPSLPSPPLMSTNTDVGFYSCEVNMVGHPAAGRVRSADTNSPGARLFVYTESTSGPPRPGKIAQSSTTVATTIYGPGAPTGTTTGCSISSFTGWVSFLNPRYSYPTTWFQRRLGTWCTATDVSELYFYGLKVLAHDTGALCVVAPTTSSAAGPSSVTFPTQPYPPGLYEFAIYITRGTLPLGMQLSLRITWH